MFEVTLLNNETGMRFTKKFESYFLCQKFLNKCSYSKKVTVVCWRHWK